MNYKTLFSSLIIAIVLVFSSNVEAQVVEQSLDNCFDYYTFQSVQVSVGTEKDNYNADDTISFLGEITNQNPYPVVDGYVFVRISKLNPNYLTEGHSAIAEFIALGPISVNASSSKEVSFEWESPSNLQSGTYRADYFFSVDKHFNLGGLPFTNEIIIGSDQFNISSTETGSVYLDRAGTKINGEKYQQIGTWPKFEAGSKVNVSQVIKNTTNKEQKVVINYALYYWDALNEKDLISEREETVVLPKGQSKILSYEIPKIEKSVYYLKVTANSEAGAQSMLGIRFSSNIESPRINYFGVTDFPIKKGEDTKIFSCFHNTSDLSTEGRMVLSAKDKNGNEISLVEYAGLIPSSVSAKASDLKALKDLTYLRLDQTLYDRNGEIKYQGSKIYDCSTLDSAKCREMTKSSLMLASAIVATLFLVLSLAFIKRNRKTSILFLAIAIIFAVLGAMLKYTESVFADTTSANGKTKTNTVSRNYDWYKGAKDDDGRLSAEGSVSVTHTVTLNGNFVLNPGDTITFSKNSDCSFNASGGSWDTPYCGDMITFTDSTGRNGGLRLRADGSFDLNVLSRNPNRLSCSGTTCTAQTIAGTSPVTAKVYAEVNGLNVVATNNSYVNTKPDGGKTENGSVCPDGTHNAIECGGSITNYNHKMYLYLDGTSTDPVILPEYITSDWTITINPPLSVSCSANPTTIDVGGSSTWSASVSGGNGQYSYLWTGTDSLTGTSTSVTKSYSTSGTKTASVTVVSSGQTSTVNCSNTVIVGNDPTNPPSNPPSGPGGSLSAICEPNRTTVPVGTSMTWSTLASGGNGVYTYSWSGSDGLTGTSSSVNKSYSVVGSKTASVSVTSNGNTVYPVCPGLTVTTSIVPTCGTLENSALYTPGMSNWPSGSFCSIGEVFWETPLFPTDGGWVDWVCVNATSSPSSVDCGVLVPEVNTINSLCKVEQGDGPAQLIPETSTTTKIYANKKATLKAELGGDYSGYNAGWFDVTASTTQIGTGYNLDKIFTTVGTRRLKLLLTKTGSDPASCYHTIIVVPKPTDIEEQ